VNDAFLACAFVLMLALLPLALVARLGSALDGLVALELVGVLTTLALVCLAVGTGSTADTGVALATAVLTWVSGPLIARFLDRRP
jgi:multisubunit Na+/H+ antiporter MnhF subunit